MAEALAREVDDFIERAGLDEKAANALRTEEERVKRAVLDRGDMSDCRNPSASLMARIRQVREVNRGRSRSRSRSRGRGGGGVAAPGGGDLPSKDEVDSFINENKIDEMAARQLRDCDGAIQRNVLDRGSLTDCRNPSAVCLARIRDAKESTRSAPPLSSLPSPVMYGFSSPGMPGGVNPYGAYAAAYQAYGAQAAAAYGGYAAMYPGYAAYPQAAMAQAGAAYQQGAAYPTGYPAMTAAAPGIPGAYGALPVPGMPGAPPPQ